MGKQVTDQSSMHRYRTEIPNIIEDMDLSVYAFRLYVRLKRVAGDDGKCFYTTRELAEQCRMSVGAVSNAKQELVEKDLIRIDSGGQWVRDNITIVDMWPANFAYFAQEKEPDACSCGEQESVSPVHVVNNAVHTVNTPVHVVNVKEEPIKKEPSKEEPKGERAQAPTPPAKPKTLRSRNAMRGANKAIHFKSPHVTNSRFDPDTGYIPPGSGTTAVEIFYERFDVCAEGQRLTGPMEDDLVRGCPDLDKLRGVIVAYNRAGFKNQRNIQLILDWYNKGIPNKYRDDPAVPSGGDYRPARMAPVDKSMAAADELRAMLRAQGKEHILHG